MIKGFNRQGLAVLQQGSRRPHTIAKAFPVEKAGQLKDLLHQSPRQYGQATSVWTLKVVAEVSWAEGLTAELVSDETIRETLKRLGISWKRAKQWITSPDPEYQTPYEAPRANAICGRLVGVSGASAWSI